MKLRTEYGAQLADLHIVMRVARLAVADEWRDRGLDEVVITATGNGTHSAGTVHGEFAFDARTWIAGTQGEQWPWAEKVAACQGIMHRLPEGFQAVPEKTHIHVELDPVWIWKLFYPDLPREYFA